jgi:hypothetical protein
MKESLSMHKIVLANSIVCMNKMTTGYSDFDSILLHRKRFEHSVHDLFKYSNNREYDEIKDSIFSLFG